MKNKLTFVVAVVVLALAVLGCGWLNPLSGSSESSNSTPSSTGEKDKNITDKAVDTAVGESKIGIPECDEVMDLVQAELDNSDDNFVAKAVKSTVLNRIKDGIREGVEKNRNSNSNKDVEEMAKTCREFRKQFDKYKAEEEAKKK